MMYKILIGTAALCLIGFAAKVSADSALPWSVFSGGGNDSTSTNYRLSSTIGQAATIGEAAAGNFRLGAGYWYGAADSDGDGIADAADFDDDDDGVFDGAETSCGSNPLDLTPPLSRPERLDGAFAGQDDDGDTAVDEALPAGSEAFDCDGDGWRGDQENVIYGDAPSTSRDQDPCGSNGWPADLSAPFNQLNIGDINSFLQPRRDLNGNTILGEPGAPPAGDDDGHGVFNKIFHTLDDTAPFDGASGIAAAMARWNLALPPHLGTTAINIGDLNALLAGGTGSPARPPMFGGQQAFFTNGGVCPWPP